MRSLILEVMTQLKPSTCLLSAPWNKLMEDACWWVIVLIINADLSGYIRSSSSMTGQQKLPQLATVVTLRLCVHSHGPSSRRGIIPLMKSWQAFDLIKTEAGCQRSQPQQQIPCALKHTQSCIHLLETHTHTFPRTPSDNSPSCARHYAVTFLCSYTIW